MTQEDPRPWEAAAVALAVIQFGTFFSSPDSPLLREREPVEPSSRMTMAEAYGDQYSEFAVVCPGETHGDRLVPSSRNLLLLRTPDGRVEEQWLRREVVEFCADDQPGFDFRPVDDSLLLDYDEEVGRWRLVRSAGPLG